MSDLPNLGNVMDKIARMQKISLEDVKVLETVVHKSRFVFKKGSSPRGAIYIGRGSKWGNPFKLKSHKDQDERRKVVVEYQNWLCDNWSEVDIAKELRNKALECFCAPLLCHGHILSIVANSDLRLVHSDKRESDED